MKTNENTIFEGLLLCNEPVVVNNIGKHDLKVYSPNLKDVVKTISKGLYERYYSFCNLSVSVLDRIDTDWIDKISKETTIDLRKQDGFFQFMFLGEIINKKTFLNSILFFTRETWKVEMSPEYRLISENGNIINSKNYKDYQRAVTIAIGDKDRKEASEIQDVQEKSKYQTKMEEARDRTDKRLRELTGKGLNESDNSLDLLDLISILSSKSNLNIVEIWKLNIYQFDNQFKRSRIADDVNLGVRRILAGASEKDVGLKNLYCKI